MLKNLYEDQRVAVSQRDLNAIMLSHERYLSYRPGTRALLSRANLDGLNLANRNLMEADFAGASLVRANASGSNLERANFYCTDLRGCNLQSARLMRADLRGASVSGTRLAYANLDNADLRAATMVYVGPGGIQVISRTDKAGLGVDFSNCSLKGASFGNAKLEGANFTGALLQDANFKNAQLTNVTFKGAVLTGVNLSELCVPASALEGCVLDVQPQAAEKLDELKHRLERHQNWIRTDGADGAPAICDGEDLRPLQHLLTGRPLTGLSARKTIGIGLDLAGSQLQGAKFDGADLRDADFTEADLRGASFKNARLAHARFGRANLGALRLANGGTLAVDLSGAGAAEEQFEHAILDGTVAALGLPILE